MRIDMLTGHSTHDTAILPAAGELADRGHQVVVLMPQDGLTVGATIPSGVHVENLDAGQADDPETPGRYGAALRRRWRNDPPDVAHALTWGAGLAAIAAGTDRPVPFVQDCRWPDGTPPAGVDGARLRKLKAVLSRRAHQVIVSGTRQAERMVRLGVPRDAIAVVPHGVTTAFYHPEGHAHRTGDTAQLVCPDGPASGHSSEEVIRALPRIPDAELVIAGRSGEKGDDVRGLADSLGVADRVDLRCDLTDEELAELYRSADLVVSTPSSEAHAAPCAEAMACGAPLVATAVDARADLVVDGVTGVFVPTDRSEQLAATVRKLLDDEPRRLAYGIAGADRASACFTWDRVIGDLADAYEHASVKGRYSAAAVSGAFRG